jgi:hypothetical protein
MGTHNAPDLEKMPGDSTALSHPVFKVDSFANCEENSPGSHFANRPSVTKPGNKGHVGPQRNQPRKLATKSG